MRIGYTIGGMMLFPGNRVGRNMTNQRSARLPSRIKDRFDLTVDASGATPQRLESIE